MRPPFYDHGALCGRCLFDDADGHELLCLWMSDWLSYVLYDDHGVLFESERERQESKCLRNSCADGCSAEAEVITPRTSTRGWKW